MSKKFPLHPRHPERICWGCDKYCPADDLACGNGSDRTQHPVELLGEDWSQWRPLDDEPREETNRSDLFSRDGEPNKQISNK